jgi:hypothetical protein
MLFGGDCVELVLTGMTHPIQNNQPDTPMAFKVEVTMGPASIGFASTWGGGI